MRAHSHERMVANTNVSILTFIHSHVHSSTHWNKKILETDKIKCEWYRMSFSIPFVSCCWQTTGYTTKIYSVSPQQVMDAPTQLYNWRQCNFKSRCRNLKRISTYLNTTGITEVILFVDECSTHSIILLKKQCFCSRCVAWQTRETLVSLNIKDKARGTTHRVHSCNRHFRSFSIPTHNWSRHALQIDFGSLAS